jgi:hypothetical protein
LKIDVLKFLDQSAPLVGVEQPKSLSVADSCFMMVSPSCFIISNFDNLSKPLKVRANSVFTCGLVAMVKGTITFFVGTSIGTMEVYQVGEGSDVNHVIEPIITGLNGSIMLTV